MKLTTEIKDLVTQIVARDVAAGVELARSIGYPMPRDFTIGVRFVENGTHTHVRMRLNDATYDSIVSLPHLDGRLALRDIVLAQIRIDKHPEVLIATDGTTKALAILDALKADSALQERWLASCREHAKHFKYT